MLLNKTVYYSPLFLRASFKPPKTLYSLPPHAYASTINKTYYEILGINNRASHQEIKKAFYVLAKKYHPDVAAGNTSETFKEINQAYETLGNREKRKRYDESLNNDQDNFGDNEFESGSHRTYNSHSYSYTREKSNQYEWTHEGPYGNWGSYENKQHNKQNGGGNQSESILFNNYKAILLSTGIWLVFVKLYGNSERRKVQGAGSSIGRRRCSRGFGDPEETGRMNLGKGMREMSKPGYLYGHSKSREESYGEIGEWKKRVEYMWENKLQGIELGKV